MLNEYGGIDSLSRSEKQYREVLCCGTIQAMHAKFTLRVHDEVSAKWQIACQVWILNLQEKIKTFICDRQDFEIRVTYFVADD